MLHRTGREAADHWLARDPEKMAPTDRMQHDQGDGFAAFGFQPAFTEASASERFIGEPLS